MQRFLPLVLDVWREAGGPRPLEDAVGSVVERLAERLPLGALLLRRLDAARGSIETAAAAGRPEAAASDAGRSELARHHLEELVAWARGGTLVHDRARRLEARFPGLIPDGVDGDVLAGPLAAGGAPIGMLLLVARRGQRFEPAHHPLARALLEPLAAALANDRRFHALETREAAAEADRLALLSRLGRQDLQESIVGAEAGFRPVMERVGLVAPSDVPVLILGETGSGKEVVARAIHVRSRRAAAAFLRVNCGAIPHGLIDSELFGHERGSFTGAEGQRKGWFERADGGTLFLDEIGELPPQAQVRLLRILQDGSFERVGGQRPLHVDVRIVAATHRDLQAMVADGRFREDLWYRIAVFPIAVPALRERPEDVPALATHFALRAATRFGTPPRIPSLEDMELLVAYRWPGNVRELSAVIERAVILGDGRVLDVATALGAASLKPQAPPRSVAGAPRERAPDTPFLTLDQAMRAHIEAALGRTRGRIEGSRGAAALLRINPHTLRARMRKLGIEWARYRPAD